MTNDVFQSRFGFHPCSYETYRKLKTIHKAYYQTLHDVARWERWERKDEQNRVIRRWERNDKGQKVSYKVVGPQPEPQFCKDLACERWGDWRADSKGFVTAYHQARMPKAKDQVKPLEKSDQEIDSMYHAVVAWSKGKEITQVA